jgi:hypothetical protein
MFRYAHFTLLVLTPLWNAGCSTTPLLSQSPDINLEVPVAFGTEVTRKSYPKGDDLVHDEIDHLVTVAPMSEYHGWFGSKTAPQASEHSWSVRVYARFSPKTSAAYTSATDGFQADLNEEPEFLGSPNRSYMYARLERKPFPWGNAVSFFSQFTQDTATYVPHNGHLTYEIWGVTPDHKYTVIARLSVSHPKLADWGPEVRDAGSIAALKQDRDFKLVEACSPQEFKPSLTSFDHIVASLRIQ